MAEYVLKFLGIFLMSSFKFISGPLLGYMAGYSLLEIMLVTIAGMMSSVFVFIFLGEWLRRQLDKRWKRKKAVFSTKSRRLVKVWQRYGAVGVAFLTPLILTPIGGTLVMTSFGVARKKIVSYMLISALWWSFAFGLSIGKLLEIPFLENLLR